MFTNLKNNKLAAVSSSDDCLAIEKNNTKLTEEENASSTKLTRLNYKFYTGFHHR